MAVAVKAAVKQAFNLANDIFFHISDKKTCTLSKSMKLHPYRIPA